MPKEALFNFIPLHKKKKLCFDTYVKITKTGQLMIPSYTLLTLLGSNEKQFFMKFYYDLEKQALGFSFPEKIQQGDDSVRIVKPHTTKQGYAFAQVSVKTFTKSLKQAELPTDRLLINKYKSGYLGEEIRYVVVPKFRKADRLNK